MNLGLPNQITGANAGKRLWFAGKSRLGGGHGPGVAQFVSSHSMPLTKEAVRAKICRAFQDIALGDGIGILEADGVDEYADKATRKAYRKQDEKKDWQRIPLEKFHQEVLCFTDAEGMRYHLPAFMIATLDHGRGYSPVFWLRDSGNPVQRELFALFSKQQREAVLEFLLFINDDPDNELDREEIDAALAGPWRRCSDDRKS